MSNSPFDEKQFMLRNRRYDLASDFLFHILSEEIKEKVNDHNRIFSNVAVIVPAHKITLIEDFKATWITPKEILDFEGKKFDLILDLDSLAETADPVGRMIQAHQHLYPDGAYIAGFFGGETLNELRKIMLLADVDVYEGTTPHIHPMIDMRDATQLMTRAGFSMPVGDSFTQKVEYDDAVALMHDLQKMARTNVLIQRRKNFSKKSLFKEVISKYKQQFSCENDRIYASFEAVFLTGYVFSKMQPKPLKPGSVTLRLSDQISKNSKN